MLNTLTVGTYNCKGNGQDRIEYIKNIMQSCDVLLLQEHWLFEENICTLEQKIDGINIFGVSAMDSNKLLTGRPHGGCAIMYKNDLMYPISPIDTGNPRICAGQVKFSDTVSFLLFCIYMPCDTTFDQSNIDVYDNVLEDIRNICSKFSNIDHILIGGDFNTDLSRRQSLHRESLDLYCATNDFSCCTRNLNANNEYTYENSLGNKSFLDHFLIAENMINSVLNVRVLHDGDNLSDHCPVVLSFDVNVTVQSVKANPIIRKPKPSWRLANQGHIDQYKLCLDNALSKLIIPNAVHCHNSTCNMHGCDIVKYHDDIVKCCIFAMNKCIPYSRPKRLAGWSDHVKPFKERSIFWHDIWIDNGKPREGIVANLMRKARADYRKAVKYIKRNQDILSADRMANALIQNNNRPFWSEVRKSLGKKYSVPSIIDDADTDEGICNVFTNKYSDLYSSVPYNRCEMDRLKFSLNKDYIDNCCNGLCTSDHDVTPNDVEIAVKRLKPHKVDGKFETYSDNIINCCDSMYTHLSHMFNCMLSHNIVPDDMLLSTIIPIPKSRKKSLNESGNYRSIALSSIIGKVLDSIIMDKNTDIMLSDHMQFGFKKGHSTTQCSFVMQEIIDYYTRNGSSVYLIMLDASRAFDRVHYIKLFRLLIKRGMCPMYSRFLANLYTNQCLRVKWNGIFSDSFHVLNGVKQGGVLSPLLFCIYIDELFIRLRRERVGCFMGNMYAGAVGYADDVSLMAPSYPAAKKMLLICEQYAEEYHVIFNSTKSVLICYNVDCQIELKLNNIMLERCDSAKHLGHYVGHDHDKINIKYACGKLFSSMNLLLSRFGGIYSETKYALFRTFCTSYYGCPLWNLESNKILKFYIAWRKCIRRLWSLPSRTHNRFIHNVCNELPIQVQLLARFATFFHTCISSKNVLVRFCTEMCSGYTNAACNRRLLSQFIQCDMEFKNMPTVKNIIRNNQTELEDPINVVYGKLIRELCGFRDQIYTCDLDPLETQVLLEYICIS